MQLLGFAYVILSLLSYVWGLSTASSKLSASKAVLDISSDPVRFPADVVIGNPLNLRYFLPSVLLGFLFSHNYSLHWL